MTGVKNTDKDKHTLDTVDKTYIQIDKQIHR